MCLFITFSCRVGKLSITHNPLTAGQTVGLKKKKKKKRSAFTFLFFETLPVKILKVDEKYQEFSRGCSCRTEIQVYSHTAQTASTGKVWYNTHMSYLSLHAKPWSNTIVERLYGEIRREKSTALVLCKKYYSTEANTRLQLSELHKSSVDLIRLNPVVV